MFKAGVVILLLFFIVKFVCFQMRWDNNRPPPTIKDFDDKVSEADAYLQLMIEQTKVSDAL